MPSQKSVLTTEIGFIYDLATFAPKGEFHSKGEGWAFTTDGKRIIMDDGTPELRFWDPDFGPSGLVRISSFGFRTLDKVTIPLRNDSENPEVIFARALSKQGVNFLSRGFIHLN